MKEHPWSREQTVNARKMEDVKLTQEDVLMSQGLTGFWTSIPDQETNVRTAVLYVYIF